MKKFFCLLVIFILAYQAVHTRSAQAETTKERSELGPITSPSRECLDSKEYQNFLAEQQICIVSRDAAYREKNEAIWERIPQTSELIVLHLEEGDLENEFWAVYDAELERFQKAESQKEYLPYLFIDTLKIIGDAGMNDSDWEVIFSRPTPIHPWSSNLQFCTRQISSRQIKKLDISALKITSIDFDQWNVARGFAGLVLPDTLKSIGVQLRHPYEGWHDVDLRIPSVEHVHGLQEYGLQVLNLPKNLKYINPTALWRLRSLLEIRVHPENETYMSVDGILFEKKDGLPQKLVVCP